MAVQIYVSLVILFGYFFSVAKSSSLDVILNLACEEGDLYEAYKLSKSTDESAESLFISASLELLLYSDANKAVNLHKDAKVMKTGVVPPLAKLHLDGKSCGGLGDIFYVTAVILKELVDSDIDKEKLLSGLTTLITLTSDSGLHQAAEKHITHALKISPRDPAFLFRAALMTPGVFESKKHIKRTRELLQTRIEHLLNVTTSDENKVLLRNLDEFVLSPTFYFIYQGENDVGILSALHSAYSAAYPQLSKVEITENMARHVYTHQQMQPSNTAHDNKGELLSSSSSSSSSSGGSGRKIKVGFVSSYFRRHSVCKLFCRLLTGLDPSLFDVVAFSSLQETHEDAHTRALKRSLSRTADQNQNEKEKHNTHNIEFVTLGKTLVQNRREVVDRAVDVLVYLDVGMEPSTVVWAAARLAPIQVCLWGHPSTTGLGSMDYFISSDKYHNKHHYNKQPALKTPPASDAAVGSLSEDVRVLRSNVTAQDSFLEQLVVLDSLGFHFDRPVLAVNFSESSQGSSTDYSQRLSYRDDSYLTAVMAALRSRGTAGSNGVLSLTESKFNGNQKIILCTQHLPKFHPDFDVILGELLLRVPNSVIVLLDSEKKHQWRRTLTARWRKSFKSLVTARLSTQSLDEQIARSRLHGRKFSGDTVLLDENATPEDMLGRIVWLPSLKPEEYLMLMSIGDVMLDPFPFGGGVTALEALAVCTPVVTLPLRQNVPNLAGGMLSSLGLSAEHERLLVTEDEQHYVDSVVRLLSDDEDSEVRTSSDGLNEHSSVQDLKVVVEVLADGSVADSVVSPASADTASSHWESLLTQVRRDVCVNAHKLFSDDETVSEWERLLVNLVHTQRV